MKLHATEAVALVEVWAGIKHYVPAKDQRACAEQYIAQIDDAGLVDLSVAGAELYGVCEVFDVALRAYCKDNGLEDETDYDDWDE